MATIVDNYIEAITTNMNSNEVFLRAALYEECAKSSILQHVDVEASTSETLRDLLNQNNSLVIRKLPIIMSKLVVKHALTFAKAKVPQLSFLTPENITVGVESDEMQYLLNSESTMKPNLVFMVSKNLLVSVVGSSIAAFKDQLINKEISYSKIPVENAANAVWSPGSSPKNYTNTFSETPLETAADATIDTANIAATDTAREQRSSANSMSKRPSVRSNRGSRRGSTSSMGSTGSSGKSWRSSSLSSTSSSVFSRTSGGAVAKNANTPRKQAASPIPNIRNISDAKKELIIGEILEPNGNRINIISNVMIKPPAAAQTAVGQEVDLAAVVAAAAAVSKTPTVEEAAFVEKSLNLADLQETNLKSHVEDFYSLVGADAPSTTPTPLHTDERIVYSDSDDDCELIADDEAADDDDDII